MRRSVLAAFLVLCLVPTIASAQTRRDRAAEIRTGDGTSPTTSVESTTSATELTDGVESGTGDSGTSREDTTAAESQAAMYSFECPLSDGSKACVTAESEAAALELCAAGAAGLGGQVQALDRVRRLADACTGLQGFLVFN